MRSKDKVSQHILRLDGAMHESRYRRPLNARPAQTPAGVIEVQSSQCAAAMGD